MILVITRMKVLPEKRIELSQTITSLSGFIGLEKGCNRWSFCRSIEDEDRLSLIEEWDTEENLITHMKSDHFRVLRGAMNLLQEPCKMTFYTAYHPKKIKNI